MFLSKAKVSPASGILTAASNVSGTHQTCTVQSRKGFDVFKSISKGGAPAVFPELLLTALSYIYLAA